VGEPSCFYFDDHQPLAKWISPLTHTHLLDDKIFVVVSEALQLHHTAQRTYPRLSYL